VSILGSRKTAKTGLGIDGSEMSGGAVGDGCVVGAAVDVGSAAAAAGVAVAFVFADGDGWEGVSVGSRPHCVTSSAISSMSPTRAPESLILIVTSVWVPASRLCILSEELIALNTAMGRPVRQKSSDPVGLGVR